MQWALESNRPITLVLRTGERFELRGRDDYITACEVFVHQFYNDNGYLAPQDIRLIVDFGANIGFSLLYFLHAYRHCNIIAYEPNPRSAVQAERNLKLDGNRNRVKLYTKAAGAKTRAMYLTDYGAGSALTVTKSSNTIAVEVEDIFPLLLGKRIDILKMDIEGGEYEILEDSRFDQLEIRNIVMEWHSRGGGKEDKHWCERRLQEAGFNIAEIFTNKDYGMFWARKNGSDMPNPLEPA